MAVLNALAPLLRPLASRWQAMPTRDRRALFVLGAVAMLLSGWFGIVAPVTDFADGQVSALREAQQDLAWMQANADAARRAGMNGGPAAAATGQSLVAAVNATAQSAGVRLQRFEPDGLQRVRVTLESAVFTDTLRWIVGLHELGLVVESFTADPLPQPGLVNIRMTLGRSS